MNRCRRRKAKRRRRHRAILWEACNVARRVTLAQMDAIVATFADVARMLPIVPFGRVLETSFDPETGELHATIEVCPASVPVLDW